MSEINTYSVTIKVEEENLAVSMGSGSLCVLATPCVVALMENAAAALADISMQTGGLALCPAAAGGGPVHLAGLLVFQVLIVALQCVHLKLGVTVGAFHLLGGAVKFDRTIAAGALIFQHSCHSVSSYYNLRGRDLLTFLPCPAVCSVIVQRA